MKKALLVYVAGRYRGPDILTIADNIARGIRTAIDLIHAGYVPYCPWLDFQYTTHQPEVGPRLTIEQLQRVSMSFLETSDAVLVLEGWETSEGTKAEIERARSLNIPVVFSIEKLEGIA